MILDDVFIVLARPSEPGNTGAVCRAMKNMGLNKLRIAAAEQPRIEFPGMGIPFNRKNYNPAERLSLEKLLIRAVHASGIWDNAEHFDSLKEAMADCTISIGTSRRRGRRRKSNSFSPRELADFLKAKEGKAAIVFGNERTGLNREELELCAIASHIPVNPEFPSLNLSHAVQIYAYELYQALSNAGGNNAVSGPAPVLGQWVPMSALEIDTLIKKISNSLQSIGFYKYPGRAEQEQFLRDLIARAGLSLSEGKYLGNIIIKAGRLNY